MQGACKVWGGLSFRLVEVADSGNIWASTVSLGVAVKIYCTVRISPFGIRGSALAG